MTDFFGLIDQLFPDSGDDSIWDTDTSDTPWDDSRDGAWDGGDDAAWFS